MVSAGTVLTFEAQSGPYCLRCSAISGECGPRFNPASHVGACYGRTGQGRVVIGFCLPVGFIEKERLAALFLSHIKTIGADKVGTVRLVPDIFSIIDLLSH